MTFPRLGESLVVDSYEGRRWLGRIPAEFDRLAGNGIINVKEPPYNARGDGVTDDTTALNLAFAQTGRIVYIPYSSTFYLVNSNLTRPVCGGIIGDGIGNSILAVATGVTRVIDWTGDGPTFIWGIEISGNATTNAVGIAMGRSTGVSDVATVQNALLAFCKISNFTGTNAVGLKVIDVLATEITGNLFAYNTVDVMFDRSGYAGSTPTTINFRSYVRASTNEGIIIRSGSDLKISSPAPIEGCGKQAILVDPASSGPGATSVSAILIQDLALENNCGTSGSEDVKVLASAASTGADVILDRCRGYATKNLVLGDGQYVNLTVDDPIIGFGATTPPVGWIARANSAKVRVLNWNKAILSGRTFVDADATPSVINGSGTYLCANTGATTITDFDDGHDDQEITVILDANTGVTDGGNLKMAGNIAGSADDAITFVRSGSTWYEKGRSVN